MSSVKLTEELLTYLFDGKLHLLSEPAAMWLGSSRRYAAFVSTFRDKIRKKIRTALDRESLLDLRLELETAYLLLQERRLNLEYEPQKSGALRCPDFAVTFTSSLTFMLEVTRIRGGRTNKTAEAERLGDAICSKLSQLVTQRSNVLLVGIDALRITQGDLHAAIFRMQRRAEQNDPMLLRGYGFRDRSDFFRHYQRLSEVLVRGLNSQVAQPMIAWINPQAKYPLPGKMRTALYNSHTI